MEQSTPTNEHAVPYVVDGMSDHCLCYNFELRGRVYEIWTDSQNQSNRCLVDPRNNEVVDTDRAFDPPLSNDELLAIYDYGRGY